MSVPTGRLLTPRRGTGTVARMADIAEERRNVEAEQHRARLSIDELRQLFHLRERRPASRLPAATVAPAGIGERLSDFVAATVGSWRFIVIQSIILMFWIAANVFAWVRAWDPYPFILLNLVLSFQAAYTAPIIMMSQNRQSDIDRDRARKDYEVNLKAELEIELLHQKIDLLREAEIMRLTHAVEDLAALLRRRGEGDAPEVPAAAAPVPPRVAGADGPDR
jgi:uncharacterized membrane protein